MQPKHIKDNYVSLQIHPIDVAIEVSKVTDDVNMICAALLHDVLGDCDVTYTDLINAGLGLQIAELVKGLTNGKNRKCDYY